MSLIESMKNYLPLENWPFTWRRRHQLPLESYQFPWRVIEGVRCLKKFIHCNIVKRSGVVYFWNIPKLEVLRLTSLSIYELIFESSFLVEVYSIWLNFFNLGYIYIYKHTHKNVNLSQIICTLYLGLLWMYKVLFGHSAMSPLNLRVERSVN